MTSSLKTVKTTNFEHLQKLCTYLCHSTLYYINRLVILSLIYVAGVAHTHVPTGHLPKYVSSVNLTGNVNVNLREIW